MIQSVCILGRQPALGMAELESLYGAKNISRITPQAAALTLPTSEVSFARLGGSTRLATVVADVASTLWKDVEKQLIKSATTIARDLPEGKIQLGFSAFDIPVTAAKLNATGLTVKKILRGKTGRSVRVTPNPELELNTAQVLHNHLTGNTGIEFLIIAHGTHTLIARTTEVQDIDSYTLRDRGRPKRDARVGMLPPKLAQIIINLAASETEPSAETFILDPFCGTGVVLQEAMLMGFSAVGSDIEQRMGDYTIANLDWLRSKYPEIEEVGRSWQLGDATTHQWETSEFTVVEGDVKDAKRVPMTINKVACETYLGRPFTTLPDHGTLEQNVSDVNLILTKFLRNIRPQLANNARLCIAVPAWQVKPHSFRHLPLLDSLEEIGYTVMEFEHVRENELLYYREDQIVARELLVLTRK